VATQKENVASQYDAGELPQSEETKVVNELYGWASKQWDSYDLTSEERATVDAVLWYLGAREVAQTLMPPGVNGLDGKGGTDEEKALMEALRSDMENLVQAQVSSAIETGLDLGNFPYLYNKYLSLELSGAEEFDALAALATARQMTFGPTTSGGE